MNDRRDTPAWPWASLSRQRSAGGLEGCAAAGGGLRVDIHDTSLREDLLSPVGLKMSCPRYRRNRDWVVVFQPVRPRCAGRFEVRAPTSAIFERAHHRIQCGFHKIMSCTEL